MAIPEDHLSEIDTSRSRQLPEAEFYRQQLLQRSIILNLIEVEKLKGKVLTENDISDLVKKAIQMYCQMMGIDEESIN